MTPAQATGLLATVGAAFLAQSITSALLYRRIRRLRVDPPDWTGESSRLRAEVRALDARLVRLEAGAGSGRKASSPAPEAKRLRRLDRKPVASADGPVLIAVPSLVVPPAATSTTEAAAEFDRRFGAIWALADTGTSPDAIARQTGYPVGQVELILGLRGPKSGGDPVHLDPARDQTDA